eukprot:jgi/Chlat1/6247/Chrsp44S09046
MDIDNKQVALLRETLDALPSLVRMRACESDCELKALLAVKWIVTVCLLSAVNKTSVLNGAHDRLLQLPLALKPLLQVEQLDNYDVPTKDSTSGVPKQKHLACYYTDPATGQRLVLLQLEASKPKVDIFNDITTSTAPFVYTLLQAVLQRIGANMTIHMRQSVLLMYQILQFVVSTNRTRVHCLPESHRLKSFGQEWKQYCVLEGNPEHEARFTARRNAAGASMFAYHGSKFHNFFSIMRNGNLLGHYSRHVFGLLWWRLHDDGHL